MPTNSNTPGLCPECGIYPPLPRDTWCWDCIQHWADYQEEKNR